MKFETDIRANFIGECNGPGERSLTPVGITTRTFYEKGAVVFDCSYFNTETSICRPAAQPCIIFDRPTLRETTNKGTLSIVIPGRQRPTTLDINRGQLVSSSLWEDEQQTVSLPQMEAALLESMMEKQGQILSTEDLITVLWDNKEPPTAYNTLQVYISNLRAKLNDKKK